MLCYALIYYEMMLYAMLSSVVMLCYPILNYFVLHYVVLRCAVCRCVYVPKNVHLASTDVANQIARGLANPEQFDLLRQQKKILF